MGLPFVSKCVNKTYANESAYFHNEAETHSRKLQNLMRFSIVGQVKVIWGYLNVKTAATLLQLYLYNSKKSSSNHEQSQRFAELTHSSFYFLLLQ